MIFKLGLTCFKRESDDSLPGNFKSRRKIQTVHSNSTCRFSFTGVQVVDPTHSIGAYEAVDDVSTNMRVDQFCIYQALPITNDLFCEWFRRLFEGSRTKFNECHLISLNQIQIGEEIRRKLEKASYCHSMTVQSQPPKD
jgi:hypothetical protein